ncbi:MAG: tetratricopeptide repeat protein, partial [Bdellovibrionales bacterium]
MKFLISTQGRVLLLAKFGFCITVVFLVLAFVSPSFAVNVQLENIGEASQIQFSGKTAWEYKISREKNNIVKIEIPKLNIKARKDLETWKASQIKKITVNSISNSKDEILVSLKKSDIESFDYQMEEPSRLIVDFFINPTKEKKQAKKKESSKRKLAGEIAIDIGVGERKKLTTDKEDKSELKKKIIADIKDSKLGTFDGGDKDFSRFKIEDYEIKESAIIASRRNIYIQFPFLIEQNNILENIISNPPIYEVTEKSAEENKQVRLIKQLFDKKRYAVFITALKFFREKFPESRYNELVRYMEADVFYALYKRDGNAVDLQRAVALYETIIKDFPKSPLAERTRLLIAYTLWDTGNKFNALKSFMRILNSNPNTKYKNDLKISIGDAYRDINKHQDALDTYNVVYLDKDSGLKGIEAKYKVGDVYALKGDFKRAIAAYEEAITEFPDKASSFPNAFYNIAESKFWLGEYKDALDMYVKYARNFPKTQHGGFAVTRIGETLQILGADEEKYKGAFLESWFRFTGSQGANIGRIRYLSHLMPKMKPIAVEAAHKEIDSYVKNSELPFIKDFGTIVLADGYYIRGELDKSFFLLENFYKENSTATTLDLFKDRIVKTITKQIAQKVEKGNHVDAIRTYGKHAGSWLRDSDRVDLRFNLGRAFEASNVSDEAIKIYKATVNRLYAIAGSEEEKERKIFESLPTAEQINLRISATNLKAKNFKESSKYLLKIKDLSKLDPSEQIEKVIVKSYLDEKDGKINQAIKLVEELVDSWKG